MQHTLTKDYLFSTAGTERTDTPGFPIRSIRVDNISNVWLTFEIGGQQRRVPPQITNFTARVEGQTANFRYENTGGLAAGTGSDDAGCTVTVASDESLAAGGVSLGGGASDLLSLTDTPGSYVGEALKHLRVNLGETAVEFNNPYADAHTWAALQTFNAGIKLAAAQQIQDSGGTGRILPATAHPHVTIDQSARINEWLGVQSAPRVSAPDCAINVSPAGRVTQSWQGISIVPVLQFIVSGAYGYGLMGTANAQLSAATVGHYMYGLNFQVNAMAVGAGTGVTKLIGVYSIPNAWAMGAGKSLTVIDQEGFVADLGVAPIAGGAVTTTNMNGVRVIGKTLSAAATVATYCGLRLEDMTGVSGVNYMMECGPAGASPYLRLLGGAVPPNAGLATEGDSNLYLLWTENGVQNLRQVRWRQQSALGAGDRVLIAV